MNFIDLMGYHEELHELFYQHQVALLRRDFTEAHRRLKWYETALFNHMRDEEDHDAREKKILYPVLDRLTTQEERINIIKKVSLLASEESIQP